MGMAELTRWSLSHNVNCYWRALIFFFSVPLLNGVLICEDIIITILSCGTS